MIAKWAVAAAAAALPGAALAQQSANEMNLVSAAQDCRVDEARTLIARGTDVNTANSAGYTPLMMAAGNGCLEIAELLVEAGADKAIRHGSFGTAAEQARMNRHAKIEALLAGAAAPPPAPAAPAAPPRIVPAAPARAQGAGPTGWPTLGTLRVGQEVLYSGTAGKTWHRGTIRSVDPVYGYNIEGMSGSYDPYFVVAPERQPFWTQYFVGDWRVSVPMAMGTVTDGTYLYRTVSGGMRLPPLRISADGTYSWRVAQDAGEKLIQGRWIANPDGPGVILQNGEQGADWLVYNNTRTGSELGETVIVASDCCSHYDGSRLR